MPAFSLTRKQARERIAAVEKALIEGHPPNETVHGARVKTARRIAAERLGVVFQTMLGQVGTPTRPGTIYRNYGLLVDWTKYQPPVAPSPPEPPAAGADEAGLASADVAPPVPPSDPPPPEPVDLIDLRRLRDAVADLRNRLKQSEQRAVAAEDIRAGVLGLTQEPLRPQLVIPSRDDVTRDGRTVILHLSDIQYGETVVLEEMDGLNKFDSTIAKTRIGRFFAHASDLMTAHWKGAKPDEIVLCLGGDMISGSIHQELAETDFPSVPESVREVGEHIAGGIIMLRNEVKCPIRVKSVPGNHGRSTDKPQSKRRAPSSFDLLASDFAEAIIRGAKLDSCAFYKSASPDVYFSTYGWHWLLTHGDTMGGRGGGTGFIGPIAVIVKGHRKLVDTSWRAGKPVHFVLTGHYHTTAKTSFGWANGSVAGYNEYARDLRADAEPALQNLLVVHPRRGIIDWKPLYLGDPSEGSLYAGPASVVRPQWGET